MRYLDIAEQKTLQKFSLVWKTNMKQRRHNTSGKARQKCVHGRGCTVSFNHKDSVIRLLEYTKLCYLGHITSPLWASVVSFCKMVILLELIS